MRAGGRPTHVPDEKTRRFVTALSGFGIEQEHIASQIGITPKTMRKHYKHELAIGTSKVIGDVAGALYKRAMDPKSGMAGVTAAIWITKTRGKWRETIVNEHGGVDGGALAGTTNISGPVQLYLPDNGRDPPENDMKLIEGSVAPRKVKALPSP